MVRSVHRPPCPRLVDLLAVALAILVVLALPGSAAAQQEPRPLQLEVFINDEATQTIAAFVQLPDGRIAARPSELIDVGIKPPQSRAADDQIVLDDIPAVTYRFDEQNQKIYFTLGDAQRVTKAYSARPEPQPVVPARADYGGVINYTLFASSMKPLDHTGLVFSGANAALDSRLFSPYGTLNQTAILGSTVGHHDEALRLDTAFTHSDPETMLAYRAGDTISGGLAWTRPIRVGGLQVQRNFGLRPDLVTFPLPMVSGSAAVPSTVDVYVNNLKTYSQDVASGPYQINNLPMITGGGTAQIVLHDAAGHEVATSLPFYTSPKLLREDLTDFSVEAGFPRLFYGHDSNAYDANPVASASARRGIFDWLTLEGHAEGGRSLLNAGLGAVTRVGSLGTLSLAGAASRFEHAFGFQSYAAWDMQLWGINLHTSSQRTFESYSDLASATARIVETTGAFGTIPSVPATQALFTTSFLPPKFLDTITVGVPVPFDKSTFSLSFLHLGLANGQDSNIVSGGYSRQLPWGATLNVTAFTDLKEKKSFGIFAGITVPLGKTITATGGVSSTGTGTNSIVEVMQPIQAEPGSYGWRVRDTEGATPYRAAEGAYRSSVGQIDGMVQEYSNSVTGSVQVDGAVAVMGGGVFLSNRINDAFAVVDAGAPGVDVLYENRSAGQTNGQGQLLIPNLRSYQSNKIAIDPRSLPVDADVPETQEFAAPADRSGVVVRFGVKAEPKAAVVILLRPDGKPIEAGSRGQLEGAGEQFTVGYDGRAYIKGLGTSNQVAVKYSGGECHASFEYEPKKNTQVVIGPVVCQ